MSESAAARPAPWWRVLVPVWSVPAAMRAVRATIVIPALFAVSLKVIGNPQMTLFAVFGGFATLLLSSFGGTRKDKALAYLGLAVVGSIVLTIGTLVSNITWLAVVVTIPVAFAIFFAGVAGPNTASGVTGALLLYVLPVATPAPAGDIGWRLAGWGMACAAATIAVLLLSPRSPGDRLRASAADSARALAQQLSRAVTGTASDADAERVTAAKHQLLNVFASAPLRPTGLATADQGLANVVELLEWCTTLTSDAVAGGHDLSQAAEPDRELLSAAAQLLDAIADLLSGTGEVPDLERLETARAASAAHQRTLTGDPDQVRREAAHAAHAQALGIAARAAVADTAIATGRADPDLIAAERQRWAGRTSGALPSRLPAASGAARLLGQHVSNRSVWFRNSLRGAVALALAVAVADVSGVQHGFWVVLGTLSVLRTNASATGATALRALAGTAVGFVVGAALLLGIGTGPTALWVALPCAILVAGYAPGTSPFAAGQAAFTITVVVVFNLLIPAGWQVGLLRVEDVGIGCVVSVIIGVLFWPRGASSIVGDDLADSFRRGGSYLTQAVDWALGLRLVPPDNAVAAATASIRLDEALRAYLTEQGTKRISKHDLWGLVMGSIRLRLTAYSVASLHEANEHQRAGGHQGAPPPPDRNSDGSRSLFQHLTAELVGFYSVVADQLSGHGSSPTPAVAPALEGPALPVGVACAGDTPPDYAPDMLWVGEYLYHLSGSAEEVAATAAQVAGLRGRPWWR